MNIYDAYKGMIILERDGLKHIALWGSLNERYIETTFTACDDGQSMHPDILLGILRRVAPINEVPSCMRCISTLLTR